MFYAVEWMRGDTVIGRQTFNDLLAAKAHAKGRFAIQKVRKGATAAVVLDTDGVTYFRLGAPAVPGAENI